MSIRIFDLKRNAVIEVERVDKTDAEWQKLLTRKQYEITSKKGTEAPGSCTFDEVHGPGVFRCVRCGTDLFKSATKFESGTGWPSFYEPVSSLNVVEQPDLSLGMARTEVLCARCGSHLGHVFDDGPPPTGKRYCMNGFALRFDPDGTSEVATLAGGCFWCIEAVYKEVDGVIEAIPGYSGGTTANPTYEQVSTGKTGHAESVQVSFDPGKVSYREILEIFFSVHDPTTLNRQGADVGTQYRSAIFYHDAQQKAVAEELVQEMTRDKMWRDKIVTQIMPLGKFYPAEDYHRDYFKKHPEQAYCQVVIAPKLEKFRKHWAKKLKTG